MKRLPKRESKKKGEASPENPRRRPCTASPLPGAADVIKNSFFGQPAQKFPSFELSYEVMLYCRGFTLDEFDGNSIGLKSFFILQKFNQLGRR